MLLATVTDVRVTGVRGSSNNKQLQRTVTRWRGRAARAAFHCARASRFARRRAAAELRRYAEMMLPRAAYAMAAATFLLSAVAFAFGSTAAAQNESFAVVVYRDHFEARGNRFDSAETLLAYLEVETVVTTSVHIRECGADERVREAVEVIRVVAAKRSSGAGVSPFTALNFASVRCPPP